MTYEQHIEVLLEHPMKRAELDRRYRYIDDSGRCRGCGDTMYRGVRHEGCEYRIDNNIQIPIMYNRRR